MDHVEVDRGGLVHAPDAPGLVYRFDLALIARQQIAVLA